jgi:hypothetical protein
MANVTYQDEGWNDLIAEIQASSAQAARTAVQLAGFHIHGAIMEKLSGQRTGKIYRVPRTDVFYQASSPNEPPASMLGNLRKNISVGRVTTEPLKQAGPDGYKLVNVDETANTFSVEVGVDLQVVPYARRLEKGGRNRDGSPFAKRPYFYTTFFEQEQNMLNILEREAKR